jgi:hypothetical protein
MSGNKLKGIKSFKDDFTLSAEETQTFGFEVTPAKRKIILKSLKKSKLVLKLRFHAYSNGEVKELQKAIIISR